MHLVETGDLTNAFALVTHMDHPVLAVKSGTLDRADCQLLRALLGCLIASVDPAVLAALQNVTSR